MSITLPLPNKPKKSCGDVPSSNHLLTTSSTGTCTPLSAHSPRWMLHRRRFKGIFKRFFYKVWEEESKTRRLGSIPGEEAAVAGCPYLAPRGCARSSPSCPCTTGLPRSAWTRPALAAPPARQAPPPSWRRQPPRGWPAGPSQRRGGPRGPHPAGPPWRTAPPRLPPSRFLFFPKSTWLVGTKLASFSSKIKSWWSRGTQELSRLCPPTIPGPETVPFAPTTRIRSLPGSATLPKLQAASFPETSGTFQKLLSAAGAGPSPQISN